MKISLWQQFSSNHSSSCIIVGQFESEEKAEQVAQEMRIMLQSIVDWWQQFSQSEQDEIANDLIARGVLTPPEQAYKEKYGLEDWSSTIILDWVQDLNALEALHRVGTLVSINQMASGISSWDGISPFGEIFRKLGGKVMFDVAEADLPLQINLRGTASNEDAAQNVIAQAQQEEADGIWTIALPGLERAEGEIEREGREVIVTGYRFYGISNHDTSLAYKNETRSQASFEGDFQRLLATLTQLGLTHIRYEIVPYKEKPI